MTDSFDFAGALTYTPGRMLDIESESVRANLCTVKITYRPLYTIWKEGDGEGPIPPGGSHTTNISSHYLASLKLFDQYPHSDALLMEEFMAWFDRMPRNIKLSDCDYLPFERPITCYDKDNLDVATSGTVRDKKGTFSKKAAASANESSKLQSRASSLKKKAHTLTKQAGQYRKAAAALAAKEAGENTWETARPPTGTEGLERHGMGYTGESERSEQ
ncbi:MAG: hypothetical protein Q9200_002266 [Gallowayella weberi]